MRGELYLPVCDRLFQGFPEISPAVDIFRVNAAMLQRFCDAAHLVDPKLVHLDVASPDFFQYEVRFFE
jgi:hypothetical protein